ncbi:hypothetical protein AVEN_77734-1 [Araneus ventricosus]|uniref:Uncharacterized protein n=1 Tax=Araneus ventricosus TaxID=182803 RepID=A0A4Y2SFZ7_ARAVE|nr:hypothetical protein AVEN_77734-1 [Araneus ventricosus]
MYNLQSSGQRHINDAVSVDAWVREMQNSDKDNCVLYYIPQSSVATSAVENTVSTASPRPINENAFNLTPNESDTLIKHVNNSESSLPFSQQREKLREYFKTLLDSLATTEELNVALTQISSIIRIVNALRSNPESNTSAFETTSRVPANKNIEQPSLKVMSSVSHGIVLKSEVTFSFITRL